MASGCVVVASRCGGFPEIITHHQNGILVEPDSASALESVMDYITRHPESASALGSAARRHIERHLTPDIAGNQMEQFYRHLLER